MRAQRRFSGKRPFASSPSAQAPAPSYPATVTFSEGAGTASITLYDAQGTALVAKEGTLEGTSDTFTVKAAAAKKFIVPAPSEQEAGVAFNVTLTATDTWGNIAKSYTGNKTITWSGPASFAQRTGSELHDDDHFHRRRRRGLRDQTI